MTFGNAVRALTLAAFGLALLHCNGDDDKAPTQPQADVEVAQVAPILLALQGALGDLNIVDLLTGGQTIEGQ